MGTETFGEDLYIDYDVSGWKRRPDIMGTETNVAVRVDYHYYELKKKTRYNGDWNIPALEGKQTKLPVEKEDPI